MENLLNRLTKRQNKGKVDLSGSDLDGSHTIALRGGEEVGYQRRKKHKNQRSILYG